MAAPQLTAEQKEIVLAASELQRGDVLIVNAYAGCGKSFTLGQVAAARKGRGLYLAFNKDIAAEAEVKFKKHRCTAKTFNSLALSSLRKSQNIKIRNVSAKQIINAGLLNRPETSKIGWPIEQVANSALRTIEIFNMSGDTELMVEHAELAVIERVGDPLEIPDARKRASANGDIEYASPFLKTLALSVWEYCLEYEYYSHDLYLKYFSLDGDLVKNTFANYNYLLVDEAQDLSPVQLSIIKQSGLPLVLVGDPHQSIYRWRGAIDAMDAFPDAKILYLSHSFRFPALIASLGWFVLQKNLQ